MGIVALFGFGRITGSAGSIAMLVAVGCFLVSFFVPQRRTLWIATAAAAAVAVFFARPLGTKAGAFALLFTVANLMIGRLRFDGDEDGDDNDEISPTAS